VRLDVDDVTRLGGVAPFAWSKYQFTRNGDQFEYLQTLGAAAEKDVGNVGWNGGETVAFRLHLPSKIRYHNTKREVGRGNILVWEQSLADRLHSVPVAYDANGRNGAFDARIDAQSILYTTLWLFGTTFAAVALAFCALVVWIVRKGARETQDQPHLT
jgi:hypothetical protein